MDDDFKPKLRVDAITSVVVDPFDSNTVFVGTDQGVYRGRLEGGKWVWTRSPGVPNVWVTDLEVHQRFIRGLTAAIEDLTGVVRAGTDGRGIFELQRTLIITPVTLSVQATRVGGDGAPPALNVKMPVTTLADKFTQETPFELSLAKDSEVILEAPDEIREGNEILKFVGWAVSDGRSEAQTKLSLKLSGSTTAIAYYERKERLPDPTAGPLRVSASASAKQVCAQSFTHELAVSWEIAGGQLPVAILIEITKPDGQVEMVDPKFLSGSRTFALSFPGGGSVKIKVTAKDASNSSSSAQSSVQLGACR